MTNQCEMGIFQMDNAISIGISIEHTLLFYPSTRTKKKVIIDLRQYPSIYFIYFLFVFFFWGGGGGGGGGGFR